ncbi:hypothetical protein PUNSTDRAFT_139652 [Punctularia strigosozonata HHB-11173 SS5]|uniref:CCHC-type domain-containing protein n=1 Tax=Punctularia strigosozonata (strain HHB-11173) TaxID=741275 RepID=R7S0K4_PUNST|nr:uncharacterized protein PUNSTDRAFT_139652 [Punctularia strigosozonata HHB-11173 SS5]EIN03332.1 hypothetical protein PUNSTDRAFT_139652 [Punctularia strigosozonata HHB-11173 SS5]
MDEDLPPAPPAVPPAPQNQPVQAEEAPPEPPTVPELLARIVAMEGYLQQERVSATIKFRRPDSFDGTRSTAQTFLRSVNDYLDHNRCVDPIQRIQFLLSYCHGGTAGTWADNISKILRDLQTGVREPEEAPDYLASWAHFERHFRAAFEDPNPAATAFNKLRTLHMGSSVAEDFIRQFENLAEEAGVDRDVSLLATFKQAIPSHFRIALESTPLGPDTLPEWKAAVACMDRRLREASAARQAEASRLHPFQPAGAPRAPPRQPMLPTYAPPLTATRPQVAVPIAPAAPRFAPPPGPPPLPPGVPMDVDATRRGGQRVCYICRQPGHLARECPQRAQIRAIGLPEDVLEQMDLIGEIWVVPADDEKAELLGAQETEDKEEDFV